MVVLMEEPSKHLDPEVAGSGSGWHIPGVPKLLELRYHFFMILTKFWTMKLYRFVFSIVFLRLLNMLQSFAQRENIP